MGFHLLAWVSFKTVKCFWGFPGGSDGKESAFSAGASGSVPGLGGSPGEGNYTPPQYLFWTIPWTEEPVGLQSMGLQRVRRD